MRIRTAAVIVLLLALAGCGGKSGRTGQAASGAGNPKATAGQLVIWADDKRAAVLKPFAEKFGAANGVTVKVQAISKDQETAFVTASQQGSGPDVTVGAHDWIGNLVRNGAIDPVQLSDEQKRGLAAGALKAVTFNGQLYGVPYATENLALIRNTDLAPKAPATVEDLVANAKRIKTPEVLCVQVGQTG